MINNPESDSKSLAFCRNLRSKKAGGGHDMARLLSFEPASTIRKFSFAFGESLDCTASDKTSSPSPRVTCRIKMYIQPSLDYRRPWLWEVALFHWLFSLRAFPLEKGESHAICQLVPQQASPLQWILFQTNVTRLSVSVFYWAFWFKVTSLSTEAFLDLECTSGKRTKADACNTFFLGPRTH